MNPTYGLGAHGHLLSIPISCPQIKMVNLIDTSQVQLLKGHAGSVKSLAFDPKGEFLASADCNGNIKLWNCNTMACVETLDVLGHTQPETYETLCVLFSTLKLRAFSPLSFCADWR
jgi:WD40 repeat protein